MLNQINDARAMKGVTVFLCSYETFAITTGRVPTITEMQRRHPILGIALVGVLSTHFVITNKSR